MALKPNEQTFQLALFTTFNLLVTELARRKVIDIDVFSTIIEAAAAHHRQIGNNFLADYIHIIAQKLIVPSGLGICDNIEPSSE